MYYSFLPNLGDDLTRAQSENQQEVQGDLLSQYNEAHTIVRSGVHPKVAATLGAQLCRVQHKYGTLLCNQGWVAQRECSKPGQEREISVEKKRLCWQAFNTATGLNQLLGLCTSAAASRTPKQDLPSAPEAYSLPPANIKVKPPQLHCNYLLFNSLLFVCNFSAPGQFLLFQIPSVLKNTPGNSASPSGPSAQMLCNVGQRGYGLLT